MKANGGVVLLYTDGRVKLINSNIIKGKKKKGDVKNCGTSRGFGFIYILVLCPWDA